MPSTAINMHDKNKDNVKTGEVFFGVEDNTWPRSRPDEEVEEQIDNN